MKTEPTLLLIFRNKSILIYQSCNVHPKYLATFLNETNSFASMA